VICIEEVMERIEFKPESVGNLAFRYHRCLEKTYTINEILCGKIAPPSQNRNCVFDFENGLRLIISKEIFGSKTGLHISASMQEGSELYENCWKLADFNRAKEGKRYFLSHVVSSFREISSDFRPMKFVEISPEKGVPHWVIIKD
jgi:hypothetical protein